MKAPQFWSKKTSWIASLLSPIAFVYGHVVSKRMARMGYTSQLPVICVGNFVAGGAGKTPAAIMIARCLQKKGYRPVFLTRGFGGQIAGPCYVDLSCHTARDVGDEAPLLARVAPVIVSRDRVEGAKLCQRYGDIIVMDDGLQNSSLEKDFTIAVLDVGQGIGNGRIIPAGPLRAPLAIQVKKADALLVMGDGDMLCHEWLLSKLPKFDAHVVPDFEQAQNLRSKSVFAFAGIGRPEKFFQTLQSIGVNLVRTEAFPDHHMFTRRTLERLLRDADHLGLSLITTAKDRVRIEAIAPDLAAPIKQLDIAIDCPNSNELTDLIFTKIQNHSAITS